MASKAVLILAIVFVLGATHQQKADAAISPRNPYRSFNISGINYGSMRWERNHRRETYPLRRPGGIVFRRR